MKESLGIAVIGCGYWGVNYVRVFSELPETHVAVICDQSEARLREIQQRFPNVDVCTDIEDALHHEDVDAVVIATQATTHFEVTQQCIAAGKHILLEKPMAITTAQAAELVQMSQAIDSVFMVGHTFLYNPGIQKVKAYIANGEIGEVYYMYAQRTNLGPIRHDVNALWDLAPHDVSIFNYLLDEKPVWVSAVGSNVLKNNRQDVGFVSIGYESGVIGNIHVSWVDPHKVRQMVVVGSEQRIVFDDVSIQERVRVYEKGVAPLESEVGSFGEFKLQIRDGNIISPLIPIGEPLKNQCRHFIECIHTGNTPITDAQAGLDVVQVMEAIDISISQHGTPIQLASLLETV